MTLWLSADATDAWRPSPSGRPGGQKRFSDVAIETALVLRLVFGLPLRQTEGFVRSVLALMGADLDAPDHTTLSRRSQQLAVMLRRIPATGPIHLIVDSSGLSIVGQGAWAVAKHGGRGRRGWRKLHLGVDQSGVILVHTLTEATGDAATTADNFYERLGPRHWIFHDSLNVSTVDEVLNQTADAASAEARLIEVHRDKGASMYWIRRLRNVAGLRERFNQVMRAREHYDADQFDSCTLHLLAIMDGFVNDVEPQTRKALSSRNANEMVTWDHVVGHHLGLTNALRSFTKTIKRRVDEQVFELHRHGIVHGSLTNYDNVVVATKAWNMLFAVVDWAAATEVLPSSSVGEESLSPNHPDTSSRF